jgi:microsomal dipeptidase-like Zn-dependent dipeptidase
MQEAAKLGAMIEFTGNASYGQQKQMEFRDFARIMRLLGWDHVILSSDFGQQGNPLHPDGLEIIFKGLRAQGVTEEQINRIVKINPAKLLGL